MPTQVIQGGGGFFDAASRAFESGAERATDYYVAKQQLDLQKQDQQLREKAFKFETEKEAYQRRKVQEQEDAIRSTLRGFSQELEGLGVDTTTLGDMDAETMMKLLETGARVRQQNATTQNIQLENKWYDVMKQGELDLMQAETRFKNIQGDLAPAELAQQEADLALRRAALAQQRQQFQLDEYRTVIELGAAAGQNPNQALQSYFGDALGNPQQMIERDLAAFETEAREGETQADFLRRKRLDRSFGFFKVSEKNRAEMEAVLETMTPQEYAMAILRDDDLSAEDKTANYALLRTAFPDEIRHFETTKRHIIGHELGKVLSGIGELWNNFVTAGTDDGFFGVPNAVSGAAAEFGARAGGAARGTGALISAGARAADRGIERAVVGGGRGVANTFRFGGQLFDETGSLLQGFGEAGRAALDPNRSSNQTR